MLSGRGWCGKGALLLALTMVAARAGTTEGETLMAAAPAGLLETGTPSFVVFGPELMGLSFSPTDLHELPNGAILVVARSEVAIGDGVRWNVIRQHPETDRDPLLAVVVDRDGALYAGLTDGFARIEFGEDAQWRYQRVASFAGVPGLQGRSFPRVSVIGDEWLWHGGSGPLVSWKPGREVRALGEMNNAERVFGVGGRIFVSDGASGALLRADERGLEPFATGLPASLDTVVTSSVLLSDGSVLAGLGAVGLHRFDGRQFRALVQGGPLGGRHRVNDLCDLGGGLYGAALDNMGIAFFDGAGRIVQMVDRSVNHRLARVRRLVRGSGGAIWALLNDGVVCVQFPSRLSDFEAYVSTGLAFSRIYRHEGRLWLQGDGRAQRGVYDADGRLVRFEPDSPPGGGFVNALSTGMDALYACAESGVYQWTGSGWRMVVAGLAKPHISGHPTPDGRWVFAAVNEVGWLREHDGSLEAVRFAAPGLGEPYVSIQFGSGVYWVELGAGRVARIRVGGTEPAVRVFDQRDGLPGSWVQVFVIDGEVGFNIGSRVYRYDAAGDRIVEVAAGESPLVGLVAEHGRPARDAASRLWLSARETVCVLGEPGAPGRTEPVFLPQSLMPVLFTMEARGVVWLHQRQRLVRYDPSIPEPAPLPLRTMIGHLQQTDSNRHGYFVSGHMADLAAQDNSFVVQLFAPGVMFRQGVGFEVLLEGGGGGWAPVGAAGMASFTRLEPGRYVLHARARSGEQVGAETMLSFSVKPPWFRTDIAYLSYGVGTLGVVLLVLWSWSLLARRERRRLELLVAERTAELRRSEESYRRLNEELEDRVNRRTTDLHKANDLLRENNRELEGFSYSIAHDLRVPLRNIGGFAELLRRRIASKLDTESARFLGIVTAETAKLSQLIDNLLAFSRISRMELKCTWLDPRALVETVLEEISAECEQRAIEWRIGAMPPLYGDLTLLRQVYGSLISNAVKFTRERTPAIIEVGAQPAADPAQGTVYFVRDNGIGFDPKYAAKLFGVFERLHTARQYEGIGIGLANVQRIITHHGGRVWAQGREGEGATFYFALPQPVAPPNRPEFHPGAG